MKISPRCRNLREESVVRMDGFMAGLGICSFGLRSFAVIAHFKVRREQIALIALEKRAM